MTAVPGAPAARSLGRPAVLAAAGVLVLTTMHHAGAQTLGVTGTFSVARATYADVRNDGVYFFGGVDYTHGRLRVSTSVPVMRQRLEVSDPLASPAHVTATGMGDPLVRLDVRLVDDRERSLQVAVAGAVKPAIVDAAGGLGTGAADYGVGASVYTFTGRTSLFADALYWTYGDTEEFVFDDALAYGVGVGRLLGNGRWSTSVSVYGFTPAGDLPPPVQIAIGVMALTGAAQSLAVTVGFGLTETASDVSLGTSWRIEPWRGPR